MAALTRARAGTVGDSLVVNLPGSPKGATESLEAIVDLVPHILQLLGGDNAHH
jgi:molybdopterin adenylyltransferase